MAREPCYVSRIPVLSTAHIHPNTLQRLLDGPADSAIAVVAPYPEGLFLYLKAPRRDDDTLRRHLPSPCGPKSPPGHIAYPADLLALYRWARRGDFDWIRLDADGDQVAGLLVYEWAPFDAPHTAINQGDHHDRRISPIQGGRPTQPARL
ncbi:hypothetical protein A167_00045 [Alcanivorax sp. S71-1-4]|uniref:DUF5983 family protein n=1 Tax=Alcanivorax sp. S71-1-4 TaxID=1177159 RepID=UPI001357E516|nr:hypothetical protein [Alcanivorax sp. S71-1-4]KAF0811013.1 hypothetical protein A167_00045 [Alcanivorax sp. S71-1-4]